MSKYSFCVSGDTLSEVAADLFRLFTALGRNVPADPADTEVEKVEKAEAVEAEKPKATKTEKVEKPKAAKAAKAEKSKAEKNDGGGVTAEEFAAHVKDAFARIGADGVRTVFGQFGAARLSEVKPESFADVMAALDAIAEPASDDDLLAD